MKRTRVILLVAASLAALVLLVLGLCLSSPVQTWAARKALAGQPGLRTELARVSISWGQARVEGLRLEAPGLLLTLPELQAKLPVFAAAGGRVELESIEARGWVLDLTQGAGAAQSAPVAVKGGAAEQAAAAFAGIFPLLKLPVDLSVGLVNLEGEVISAGAQPGQRVRSQVWITGGGLGAGREGKLSVRLAADSGAGAPVSEMKLNAVLQLGMDTPRTISSVACEVQVEASGPQFPSGAHLLLSSRAQKSGVGETYELVVHRDKEQLLSVKAALPAGGGKLEGTWTVRTSDGDLAPFSLGRVLPLFEVSGTGAFSVLLPGGDLQLSGELSTRADRLSVVDARLAALGATELRSSFDVVSAASYLRIRKLQASVASGSVPVAEIEALQGFEFEYAGAQLKVSDPSRQLLRVQLKALPLAWLSPFVPDLALKGRELSGEWTLAAHAGGFSLLTSRELKAGSLSVSQGGAVLVEGLDLTASFRADYTPEGWQLDLSTLRLLSGRQALAELQLKAGQRKGEGQPVILQGGGKGELAALARQPVGRAIAALEKGQVSMEFQGSLAKASDLHLKLNCSGLSAGGQALPKLGLELRASLSAEGVLTCTAPLQIDNEAQGRISDLSLEGTLETGGVPLKVDAKLLGRVLVVEDLQAFAAAFHAPDAAPVTRGAAGGAGPSKAEPQPAPVPDTRAAWAGIEGTLQLAVGRLVLNANSELQELRTRLLISEGELRIEQLRARGDTGTTLSFDGTLHFERGETPYGLEAQLRANAFDVSGFTSAKDAYSPTLNAKFDINSRLAGRGATLPDLFQRSTGTFDLLSKGGKFRLLRSDITEFLQGKSGLGSLFMGSLGSLLSSKNADKEGEGRGGARLDEYASMAVELADYFAEIPFDQFSVVLVRDDKLNIQLQDLALISPMVRLTGTGGMTHAPHKAFSEQPMEIQLQLATRGRMAEIFGKAGLLREDKDNLGYQPLNRLIQVRGTLGRPDSSEFRELLRKVALQKADAFLDRIIGTGR